MLRDCRELRSRLSASGARRRARPRSRDRRRRRRHRARRQPAVAAAVLARDASGRWTSLIRRARCSILARRSWCSSHGDRDQARFAAARCSSARSASARASRRFRLYKFRTMVVDAEGAARRCSPRAPTPDWLKLDHDPRVTRLGRSCGASSLDELPQLWNVLRGEMSLVGPRPLIPAEDEHGHRLGSRPPRPDPRDHRVLAGAGPDADPVRGDGEARLPLRNELVPLGGRATDVPDAADRDRLAGQGSN